MPVSPEFSKSVGVLIRNLRNPRWYASQATSQVVSTYVVNPYGKKVKAWLKAQLHIHDTDSQGRLIKAHHIADAYECEDGYEYMDYQGQKYLHDRRNNTWIPA